MRRCSFMLLMSISTQLFSLPQNSINDAMEKNIAKNMNLERQKCRDDCKTPRSPPGPTGPIGLQGPSGPSGPPATPAFLSVFITSECSAESCIFIFPQAPVIFDTFAVPTQGTAISYDTTTGTVTFNTPGFYQVNYGMTIDPTPFGALVLQINPAGIYTFIPGFVAGSGLVPGSVLEISSTDTMTRQTIIIEITQIHQTLQLINGNINAPGNTIAMDTQTEGTALTPVLAFLHIKLLNQ